MSLDAFAWPWLAAWFGGWRLEEAIDATQRDCTSLRMLHRSPGVAQQNPGKHAMKLMNIAQLLHKTWVTLRFTQATVVLARTRAQSQGQGSIAVSDE